MSRQINLLSREARGANHELLALVFFGIFLLGLIGFGFYNHREIAKREDAILANAEAILQAQATFKQKRTEAGLPDIEAIEQEIIAIKSKLAANAQLIALMEKGGLGDPVGHTRFMTTLASRHDPNIWITSIELDERNDSLAISGRSLNRESVMRYANTLNRFIKGKSLSPVFTGVEMVEDEAASATQPNLKRTEIRFRLN